MLISNRFASFSVDTMRPLLIELALEEPALLAVTKDVQESFFRFVQDRRTLEDLPDKAMRNEQGRQGEAHNAGVGAPHAHSCSWIPALPQDS